MFWWPPHTATMDCHTGNTFYYTWNELINVKIWMVLTYIWAYLVQEGGPSDIFYLMD